MNSYYRRCRVCGRLIQLRQMPAGQWVAYEGYDKIHDCNEPPPEKVSRKFQSEQADKQKGYEDLEFKDIKLSEEAKKEKKKGPLFEQAIYQKVKVKSHREEIRELLDRAIRENRVIHITYKKKFGEVIIRDFEPLSREQDSCYGYCRLRNDYRNLLIPSILEIQILEERFVPKPKELHNGSGIYHIIKKYDSYNLLKKRAFLWVKSALSWVFWLAVILIALKVCSQ